ANTDWLIYMAQAQGLFEKAGLAPEFVKFAQGSAMTAAIQSQSIDVANTGVVPFTAALAQGVPLTAVALSLAVANSEGFVARPESGIQTVADLRGKKISYAKGSTSHLAVLRMLQKENIPISEVTILEMPPAEQLAAFLNKNIDVAEVWEPWQQKMIRQGNGYIVAQEKDLGLKTAFALDAVRTDWLASNQEAAKRFLIALLMARDELRKDPTPALKQVAELMGITEEESAIIYEKDPEPDLYRGGDPSYEWAIAKGGLPSQALADVNDFLAENNVIARKADLSQAIDTGPLEAALKEHPQPQ
ncbi:MAG: ABC transporter substrate-binding protein, partial [Pseudomonadota bacterium]|nr:ABC transporter substrate-binding protein [Pseudomonadota bacterium]